MIKLPQKVSPYRTIGPFTEKTLPAGLLQEHRTKAGVWGLLEVTAGQVQYTVTESEEEATHVLDETTPGVIVPEQTHHLTLVGPVELQITFHREPTR